MDLAPYRKSIAAGVGLALILGKKHFGYDLPTEAADMLVDAIMGAGTAFAVFMLRNRKVRRPRPPLPQ